MPEWEILDEGRPILGRRYGAQRARMLAFDLADGGLCVVSPGSGIGDDALAELDARGPVRFVLAPNHFHNAGIRAWRDRYRDAVVTAHERAIPRLRRQVPGVEFEDLTRLRAALRPGDRLFSPPMAKQGETWVSLDAPGGRTWFVTDGIVNETRLPRGPLGVMMRVLGYREELMANPVFRRLFITDRQAYADWVAEQVAADPPTVFVPGHGAVLRGADVGERLRAACVA